MFYFFYINFTSNYWPDLYGAVLLTSWNLVATHCVLLVSVWRGLELFSRMGTHSVYQTSMCKIIVYSTITASVPITAVLCTASSSTAIIGLVTMVSTSYLVLTASIVLICTLRHCRILYLHCLHHQFRLLQLCGQLLLGVFHSIGHMIYRRLQDLWSLRLDLILLQGYM